MTDIEKPISYERLTALAKSAIAQAIERHRKLGESIAVWKDGKVVVLIAEQIPEPGSRLNEGEILSDMDGEPS